MLYGDTLYWNLLAKKTLFLPCVKKDKIQPFTFHYVHLNPMLFQNLNLPNYWQAHRHTSDCDTLLHRTNQIQIKDN